MLVAFSTPPLVPRRGGVSWQALMLAATLVPGSISAQPAGDLPLHELRPLAERFCFECHDDVVAEAELDLKTLLAQSGPGAFDHRVIEQVLRAIGDAEMPPRKADAQPSPAERTQMLGVLQRQLEQLQTSQRDDPGHVVMARLTRHEYRNVIRDLSGGVVRNGGELLPNEGGAGEGFANVGEAQGMGVAQFEKYLEAAKGALRHLRASPVFGLEWRAVGADPVDAPAEARADAIYAIVQWYFRQQQRWGAEHRDDLQARLGFNHAAYLEAAWQYRFREQLGNSGAALADFARRYEVPLGPVSLAKWWTILNDSAPDSPFATWAAAWRELPPPAAIDAAALRLRCQEIVAGAGSTAQDDAGDYAPAYEVSFHEAREEVLRAATGDRRWPFRIDIGDARELFLVITDAGDGGNEFALWRQGRFVFGDGSARPWQDATQLAGANSGRPYPFGHDATNAARLAPDSVGVRAPGALTFVVPEGAVTFEVEAALDEQHTKVASIQALVLKEKPRSQSFVPGRKVFGGRARQVTDPAARAKRERDRFLRIRNVAEANQTKLGLNAERNVLAHWIRTPLAYLGGPWPDHTADKPEPRAPYHFTAEEIRANTTPEALEELAALEERLAALVQQPQQDLLAWLRTQGVETAREGTLPSPDLASGWPAEARDRLALLHRAVQADEARLAERAQPLLQAFARRAWRRPLRDGEGSALLALYQAARTEGASFDSAIKAPLLAVLSSPHFLYRGLFPSEAVATASSGRTVPLSGLELASRLSFFLWASIPDDELIELAARGVLQDPATLQGQAKRLLADPRAESLATDFAGQLWGFTAFAQFTNPDAERFPEFTPALRQAMLQEVTTFLADAFRGVRPLTGLLEADYTFANQLLAEHYGLPAPSPAPADAFVRVPLPAEQRGGLATMGLFLTQTSLPLRTSPVQRGVWLLEQLLGRHLPNPPANVPQLSEDDRNSAGENIRQQLERHRADPSCASCHDRIDPLGIALENFDAIGRWRTADRDGGTLATRATTHDGVDLHGAAGLRAYLAARQGEFFRHFLRKLLGYALGRAVSPGDEALLQRMQKRLPATNHAFSPLVAEIVISPQFMTRRAEARPHKSS